MKEPMNDKDQQGREAQLARLADGSLPASLVAELQAEVARDPQRAAALAEQQRAVSMLRALDEPAPASLRQRVLDSAAAAGDRPAPASLRARVAGLTGGAGGRDRAGAAPSAGRRRFALPAALGALGAVAAAIVVVLLIGGSRSEPTIPQTAQIALAGSTAPAPRIDTADPEQLDLQVAGIHFPNWESRSGYTAVGARAGLLAGRRVVTVYYTGDGGARLGYAIVSGPPLRSIAGTAQWMHGVRFTIARQGSARFVTWVRLGHTCVIAATSVPASTLLTLASYET